jgi:hypothetical protein
MAGIVNLGLTLPTLLSSIMKMHTVMPCTCPCFDPAKRELWDFKIKTEHFFSL